MKNTIGIITLLLVSQSGFAEESQTKAYPRSTGNLPNQSTRTPRRELVRLGWRDDDYGRKRGRWSAGHHPDRHGRPGCSAQRAAPALLPGIAIDFGQS